MDDVARKSSSAPWNFRAGLRLSSTYFEFASITDVCDYGTGAQNRIYTPVGAFSPAFPSKILENGSGEGPSCVQDGTKNRCDSPFRASLDPVREKKVTRRNPHPFTPRKPPGPQPPEIPHFSQITKQLQRQPQYHWQCLQSNSSGQFTVAEHQQPGQHFFVSVFPQTCARTGPKTLVSLRLDHTPTI